MIVTGQYGFYKVTFEKVKQNPKPETQSRLCSTPFKCCNLLLLTVRCSTPIRLKTMENSLAKSQSCLPTEKDVGGRPTPYRAAFCKIAKQMSLLGATDQQLADALDVSKSTIELWKLKHPKFSDSIRDGKVFADAKVAESLYKRATGFTQKVKKAFQHEGVVTMHEVEEHYPPDATAALKWLRNRQRALWCDSPEVQVNVANSLSMTAPEEWTPEQIMLALEKSGAVTRTEVSRLPENAEVD